MYSASRHCGSGCNRPSIQLNPSKGAQTLFNAYVYAQGVQKHSFRVGTHRSSVTCLNQDEGLQLTKYDEPSLIRMICVCWCGSFSVAPSTPHPDSSDGMRWNETVMSMDELISQSILSTFSSRTGLSRARFSSFTNPAAS